jgi:flagellar basal body-associated protein FliL
MGIIEKLEVILNNLLLKLFHQLMRLVPNRIKLFFNKIAMFYQFVKSKILQSPKITLNFLKLSVNWLKTLLERHKTNLNEKIKTPLKNQNKKELITNFLSLPLVFLKNWFHSLSVTQFLLLMTFTGASLLALIGIGFSGHRLTKNYLHNSRSPASIEDEVVYERPAYYKQEKRHAQVSNLRLPIFFPKLNEYKSIDIDFVVTLSNRQSRIFLEKHDFQLKDYLILQVEPLQPSFTLGEEGKEILRDKLKLEVNNFLKNNNIEGQVQDLKITFTLAN